MALDPKRTVTELKELRGLTEDENGAQRVAWTETWEHARTWLRGLVAGTGVEESTDAAGNQWFTLAGASDRALLVGGHIDSVPNGGWLDGCLNVVAGAEVLRRVADEGIPGDAPARQLGRRGGRALREEPLRLQRRRGLDGRPERATAARGRRRRRASGRARRVRRRPRQRARRPVRARERRCLPRAPHRARARPRISRSPLGVVLGTFGVERHRITWSGQAAHAGSTPMDKRRDALAGAAKLALEIRDIARATGDGAVCTSGGVVCKPGIVTSVVETAEQLLDQRHLDAARLGSMLADAKSASERFAAEESIDVEERIWSIEPIFDETLVGFCDEAIREVAGAVHHLRPPVRCTTPPRCPAPGFRP